MWLEVAFISLFFYRPKLFMVLALLPEVGAYSLFAIYAYRYLMWLELEIGWE